MWKLRAGDTDPPLLEHLLIKLFGGSVDTFYTGSHEAFMMYVSKSIPIGKPFTPEGADAA